MNKRFVCRVATGVYLPKGIPIGATHEIVVCYNPVKNIWPIIHSQLARLIDHRRRYLCYITTIQSYVVVGTFRISLFHNIALGRP